MFSETEAPTVGNPSSSRETGLEDREEGCETTVDVAE
jgi:hypothetical protein